MPLIATSRIHEPAEAEALLAAGAADAVGMTRALIADPDLPRRLVEGREDERILCTGCNQGCIGHYHLGHADLVPAEPAHGARGARCRSRRRRPARACSWWAAARRAWRPPWPRRARAPRSRWPRPARALGGQFALAGRAPAHRETAARYAADWTRRLEAAGVHVRLDTRDRRPTRRSRPRPIA